MANRNKVILSALSSLTALIEHLERETEQTPPPCKSKPITLYGEIYDGQAEVFSWEKGPCDNVKITLEAGGKAKWEYIV